MMGRIFLLCSALLTGFAVSPLGSSAVSYAAHSHRPVHQSAGRALVLEPFATQLGLGSGAADPEVAKLQAAGFSVKALSDTEVTVAVMQTLPEYNVIYVNTHSDPVQGGDGVVATGQLTTDQSSVAPFVQDGSIVPVSVSTPNGQSTEHYWAINASFIQNHMGTFPHDSILVLNGCGILNAPGFVLALQAKGLGVLVSWDREATTTDNYLSGNAFLNEMDTGLSVADAISAIKAVGLGTSNPQGQGGKATLGYIGDGTITFQRAAAGAVTAATATPIATATPAPTGATPTSSVPTPTPLPLNTVVPTPSPTPTPVPPPLHVQLKPRVEPGGRQVIRITSDPDTIIHIHVQFPNGDSRTATTATDPHGAATYSFPQHPGKIVYHHLFAMVTIQAVKNSGMATVTQKYRIGWDPIDVSVDPRVQSVSKVVNIWVHTQPRTRVTVTLIFPKQGNDTSLHGVTGAHGWAHLQYTVGRYLKLGANHVVQVRAKARLTASVYHAATTFTIV